MFLTVSGLGAGGGFAYSVFRVLFLLLLFGVQYDSVALVLQPSWFWVAVRSLGLKNTQARSFPRALFSNIFFFYLIILTCLHFESGTF